MRTRLTPTLISVLAVVLLALGLVAPAIAADEDKGLERRASESFEVYHGPVTITLADPASDGHQLGDLRVTSVETTDSDGSVIGRLDASLTTTAIDTPTTGDEIRIGSLVFNFGDLDPSQLVVDGSAIYPADGPTIATGDSTVRPVTGGSGRFTGATGEAVSTHLEDGTWVHRFDLGRSGAGRALDRSARMELRDERRADRAADRDERRADRAAARDERKADREAARDERSAARDERRAQRQADADAGAAGDESGVVQTGLGSATPGTAPGQQLGLWHYTISAGERLAPHTHPGWQLAHVTEGELEYSVISGEGRLIRADGTVEPMGPGTYVLASGDGVIENPDLVHFGANRTDDVVTLVSATLYPTGEPLATLVEEPATSE